MKQAFTLPESTVASSPASILNLGRKVMFRPIHEGDGAGHVRTGWDCGMCFGFKQDTMRMNDPIHVEVCGRFVGRGGSMAPSICAGHGRFPRPSSRVKRDGFKSDPFTRVKPVKENDGRRKVASFPWIQSPGFEIIN